MKSDHEQIKQDRARVLTFAEAIRRYYDGEISAEEYAAARERHNRMLDEAGSHLYNVAHPSRPRDADRRSFWRGVLALFRW